MRDALLIGGAIGAGVTKEVIVAGANTLDFAALNSRYSRTGHRTGVQDGPMRAVFRQLVADLDAIDQWSGVVSHCATVGGTYTKCAETKLSGAGSKLGTILECAVPIDHLEFLRLDVLPHSSGTFGATTNTTTYDAYLEFGSQA